VKTFITAGAMYLACFFSAQAWGQLGVSAELDSARILIGDQVRLQILINHVPHATLKSLDWSALAKIPGLEILSQPPIDTIASGKDYLLRQQLVLTSFDSGAYQLSGIVAHFEFNGHPESVLANELTLRVDPFPISDAEAQLAPIKDIIEEPLMFWDLAPFIFLALGALLLTALAAHLFRRKRRRLAPPLPPRPPHLIALEKLAALRREQPWLKGEIKDYYSRLSHILREYLENRFGIPALESTSGEALALARTLNQISSWLPFLEQLLLTADLVKFAKAIPPDEVHGDFLEQSEAFIHAGALNMEEQTIENLS
jgi:hypothetical protein